jgi:hypothetical protein
LNERRVDAPARFVSTGAVRLVELRIARAALAAVALGGCAAGRVTPDGGDTDSAACRLDPTGSFTFHFHNAGTYPLLFRIGCHLALPITLATPAGRLPIVPDDVDTCGFTCDEIYAGHVTPGACTACDSGGFKDLVPGDTADAVWDRRVYARHDARPPCAAVVGTCALGTAVAPAPAQRGAIGVCGPDVHEPTPACVQEIESEFTVDTTGAEATIELRGP